MAKINRDEEGFYDWENNTLYAIFQLSGLITWLTSVILNPPRGRSLVTYKSLVECELEVVIITENPLFCLCWFHSSVSR